MKNGKKIFNSNILVLSVILVIALLFAKRIGVLDQLVPNILAQVVISIVGLLAVTLYSISNKDDDGKKQNNTTTYDKDTIKKLFEDKLKDALKEKKLGWLQFEIKDDEKTSNNKFLCRVSWNTRFKNKQEDYPGYSRFFLEYVFNLAGLESGNNNDNSINLRLGQETPLLARNKSDKSLKNRKIKEVIGIENLRKPLTIIKTEGIYHIDDGKKLYTCTYNSIASIKRESNISKDLNKLASNYIDYYQDALNFAPRCYK